MSNRPASPDPRDEIPAGETNAVDGLALRGYDPVAYIVAGRAVRGRADITHVKDGITYRFASAEHRDRFIKEPERYLPMFGGYCALGVAEGHKADTDPEAFTIVDGKLYLNYSIEVMGEWRDARAENLAKAAANWPDVRTHETVER